MSNMVTSRNACCEVFMEGGKEKATKYAPSHKQYCSYQGAAVIVLTTHQRLCNSF